METSFSNDDIQLQVTKKTGCTVEYNVTCSKALIEKARKQAIKKIAKEITLPGFRKGKVPEDVVVKNYSKAVEAETKEELTQLGFQKARTLDTTPIMQTDGAVGAKMVQFDDQTAVFQYFLTTNPETPDLSFLENTTLATKPLKEVTDLDVEKEVKNLLRLFAQWKEITDRAVQEGDFVKINGFDLSHEPNTQIFNESRLEVSAEGMSTEWLYEALIGMQLNESKEVTTFANRNEPQQIQDQFASKKVRLEVVKIEEPELPTLSDEFVQKFGLPSVQDLYNEMRKRLENESLGSHVQSLKDSLIESMLKNVTLDVPTLLVDRELASRMRRYLSSNQGKKEYEALSKEEQEIKRAEIRSKAEEAIRLYFIIQAIIRKYQVQPPADIKEQMTEIAKKYVTEGATKRTSQQMVQQAQNEQNQHIAQLMMDTALTHVLDKVLHVFPSHAKTA
jgi:trigger factor